MGTADRTDRTDVAGGTERTTAPAGEREKRTAGTARGTAVTSGADAASRTSGTAGVTAADDVAAVDGTGGFGALVRDTWLVFARHGRRTLRTKVAVAFGVMQPLLYLVLFGPLLAQVAGTRGFGEGGAWQVFVPGVMVQLALFGAGFVGFGLIADLRSGVVERLRVTPISRAALLAGRVAHDTAVVTVQAVLLLGVGTALGLRAPVAGAVTAVALVVVLAVAVASLSYVLALATRSEDAFAPLLSAVTLPLMLLSGILLPMGMAPGWLRALSWCTPLRYVVDAARAALLGRFESVALVRGAGVALVLAALSLALGVHRFRRENA
ncbi:ABC transporter permease [Actinomadura sp. PM05-2]|uniref:Transport permease protein n=2 Tax=Actinomadura parmotrematis TaxID=2864039 RepID=A0ABS7FQU3_9ACTN|nr:ABC transporter permease [Actinomadura parmotrematis]